jgi:hypothetical protein
MASFRIIGKNGEIAYRSQIPAKSGAKSNKEEGGAASVSLRQLLASLNNEGRGIAG